MKKYGSLFFVVAMVISSVARADIPIVHQQGNDLQKEVEKKHGVRDGDKTKLCAGAALEHCEVGAGCTLTCPKPEAANTTKATRKTAAVKNTDSAE